MATILEYNNPSAAGKWQIRPEKTLDTENLPPICYAFLTKDLYPKSETERGKLLSPFNVPRFLNNDTCTDLNGYFGCRGTYKGEKLGSYSTWFRCIVKIIWVDKDTRPEWHKMGFFNGWVDKDIQKGYKWHEMGFFTCWDDSGSCRVLCIDTPEILRSDLKAALDGSPPELQDPFVMHIPLIDQLIKLYDRSVWLIRDPVRAIEKNRQSSGPNFEKMHEISRHAIHVSEVLEVSIDTLQKIQEKQEAVYKSLPEELSKTYEEQAKEYIAFQLQMAKSLLLRSKSNHERLKSEITVAYNIIAQQDNWVMKVIGMLTTAILPATYVTSVFSTSFFDFGHDKLQTSKQIWIYILFMILACVPVAVTWYVWRRGPLRSHLISKYWRRAFPKKTPVKLETIATV